MAVEYLAYGGLVSEYNLRRVTSASSDGSVAERRLDNVGWAVDAGETGK